MQTEFKYRGLTFEVKFDLSVRLYIATWRGYSAEGLSIPLALKHCYTMIMEDDLVEDSSAEVKGQIE